MSSTIPNPADLLWKRQTSKDFFQNIKQENIGSTNLLNISKGLVYEHQENTQAKKSIWVTEERQNQWKNKNQPQSLHTQENVLVRVLINHLSNGWMLLKRHQREIIVLKVDPVDALKLYYKKLLTLNVLLVN